MSTTDKRLVIEMLLALVQTECRYVETDGLALSLTPHGSVEMLDTRNDTVISLECTPHQLIWSLAQ